MGKVYSEIDDRIAKFIRDQKLFFVASAPLSGDGLVNLSPKGLDTFTVLNPNSVAYLDLVGSGIETVAHLRENGRICLMFCAFEGAPNIIRLYGLGRVVEPGDPDFDLSVFGAGEDPSIRAVIHMDVERVADSCGCARRTTSRTCAPSSRSSSPRSRTRSRRPGSSTRSWRS